MRDFQLPGRSPVHATEGMAATPNPLATSTSRRRCCGAAAMPPSTPRWPRRRCWRWSSPTRPASAATASCSMRPKGQGPLIGLNGSGRAPQAATAEWYREHGMTAIPPYNPHAVTVPGAIDAWARLLADHGTKGSMSSCSRRSAMPSRAFRSTAASARSGTWMPNGSGAIPTRPASFCPRGERRSRAKWSATPSSERRCAKWPRKAATASIAARWPKTSSPICGSSARCIAWMI